MAEVEVQILPNRSVILDGRRRDEGAVVSVAKREADTLLAEGYATKKLTQPASKPKKPRPRRARKPLVLDEAEPELLERG